MATAKENAIKIQSDTEKLAAQEMRKLQSDLRSELTEAAFELAEKRLDERLDGKEQERLQQEYLLELGASS